MVLMAVAFCLATLAVYALNRLPLDYMEYASVAAGGLLLLIIILLGSQILSLSVPILPLVIGCLAAILAALVISFCLGSYDYSRPEFLKYEDDEYRYYVKAVPRMVVPKSERKIQEISGHRRPAEEKSQPAAGQDSSGALREASRDVPRENGREAAQERPAERTRETDREKPREKAKEKPEIEELE